MMEVNRKNIMKILELVLAIILCVLHDNSFPLSRSGSPMIITGTFIGYLIILSGLVYGILVDSTLDNKLDLYFSFLGAILHIVSGILTYIYFDVKILNMHYNNGQVKSEVAIITGIVYAVDSWDTCEKIKIMTFTNPNPRKPLYVLTVLQLWFQLVSVILLSNSCLIRWQFETNDTESSDRSIDYGAFYFKTSLMFQLADIVLSFCASCHLQSSICLYNNMQDVKIWMMVNNFYCSTSIVWLIYVLRSQSIVSVLILVKTLIICLFGSYKMYVVYRIYKDEKSSCIVLEQNVAMLSESSSETSNNCQEDQMLSQCHVVEFETVAQ